MRKNIFPRRIRIRLGNYYIDVLLVDFENAGFFKPKFYRIQGK